MFNSNAPSNDDLPSSRQLLTSTVLAAVAAVIILVTFVLPSEYGVDPTGAGRVLGLTEMGQIKSQLAEEAEQDRQEVVPVKMEQPAQSLPADQGSSLMQTIGSFFVSSAYAQEMKSDTMTLTFKPGESAEVKVSANQGAVIIYKWTTEGGGLNYDLHADSSDGASTSYKKGRAQPGDEGQFEAAFDGKHGWFWRNRGDADVTMTLTTQGDYSVLERIK